MLPQLVGAAALLASGAPLGYARLDFFAGIGAGNIDEIKLYFSDPSAARQKNMQDRDEVRQATSDQQFEMLASLMSGPDAAVLTDEFAKWLLVTEQAGLAPGDQ
jgi:hypothetical protein